MVLTVSIKSEKASLDAALLKLSWRRYVQDIASAAKNTQMLDVGFSTEE